MLHRRATLPWALATALVLLAALATAPAARACMTTPPDCPPFEFCLPEITTVTQTGERTATLSFPGYVTTHLAPPTRCVLALSPVAGVESVDAITNHDSRTGQPFSAVRFFADGGPADDIGQLATDLGHAGDKNGWSPFLSEITDEVADGVPNHFVVALTLKEGVTLEDLVKSLQDHGVFLTAPSNGAGVPDGDHAIFRSLRDEDIVVIFPAK
jgi:hypothetical protein